MTSAEIAIVLIVIIVGCFVSELFIVKHFEKKVIAEIENQEIQIEQEKYDEEVGNIVFRRTFWILTPITLVAFLATSYLLALHGL